MKKLLFVIALFAINLGSAVAAPEPALSIADIWKPPLMLSPAISQDGKYFAVTMPLDGRMNLVVMDLETRKGSRLTNFKDFDVISVHWVGSDRLLFSLGQINSPTGPGRFDGGGLYMVSRDGSESRRLSPSVKEMRAQNQFVYRGLELFRSIPGNDEEVIAIGNMTSADVSDLYRLNIRTGKHTLLTQGRPKGNSALWLMDSNLVPRVVTSWIKNTLTMVVSYRRDAQSDWYEIARYEWNKGPTFVPLAFESDNRTLQVAYNGNRDTMAVFRYDPDKKQLGELIAQHPKFDMGAAADGSDVPGVIVAPKTDAIIGYKVAAAKPETVWIDETYARIQAMLDRAMPDRINSFRRTPDGKRFLVASYSDVLPVTYHLFDEEKRSIEEIGSSKPWLEGKLVEQRPFTYKTRDGLEISGYYFLPQGYKPGTQLPTVVHVHGGPMARADFWGGGFGVREGQLFASRGYAVIVPNHRITPGLGSKIYYAGFGAYGREMSDDHEDALQWGVQQGFVDPARACVSGASYGGYAALQALIRSQSLWKCAIAGLAPTDLKYQLTTTDGDTSSSESAVEYWKSVLGEKNLDAASVKRVSPLFNAAQIKQPVFLYAGQDDIRVPIRQIEEMASALKAAGNPPKEFVVKKGEGHGFGKLENNVELYEKILAFLKKEIGP